MTPEQLAAWALFGDPNWQVRARHVPMMMPGAPDTRVTYDDLVGVFRGLEVQGVVVTLPEVVS